ncbi:MAG: DUF4105 domain-containing protein [Gemmatimonadaceae bacterium]
MLHALARLFRRVLPAAIIGMLAGRVSAQSQAPPSRFLVDALHAPGKDVTISLLTAGNGEEIWEMFGHSAIWIHDNVTARDTVFNWGVFDSTKPNFILHFLKGLMLYQMGGNTIDQLINGYRYMNRTLVSQELDLTTQQKDSLLHLIQINAEPRNIVYRYDYFRNNCATRPRDLFDAVLGGQLHEFSKQIMPTSYRFHALRLMQSNTLLDLGVDIGLGEPSDAPIHRWDEMFLPREMHDILAKMPVHDSTGATHPLVKAEHVLFQSTRGPEPEAPPNMAPWLLAVGLVIGGVFAWLGARAIAGKHGASAAAAVLFGVWSLVAGLLGVVLTILWTVTDHDFAHRNENLLLFNPLWLLLVVLLPLALMRGRAAAFARRLSMALAVLTVLGLVAHLVLLSRQTNLALVGLALPPALAIAWTMRRMQSR